MKRGLNKKEISALKKNIILYYKCFGVAELEKRVLIVEFPEEHEEP